MKPELSSRRTATIIHSAVFLRSSIRLRNKENTPLLCLPWQIRMKRRSVKLYLEQNKDNKLEFNFAWLHKGVSETQGGRINVENKNQRAFL